MADNANLGDFTRNIGCCKRCFICVNVFGSLASFIILFVAIIGMESNKDLDERCQLFKLRDTVLDVQALGNAAIFFAFCGLIIYPLGMIGVMTKNRIKLFTKIYISGMAVIAISQVVFLIFFSVVISSGFDKDVYTGCLYNKLEHFYDNETDPFVAEQFKKYDCCSPDGNIVEFWSKTNWYKDPARPANYEVPIQCCKKNSVECRPRGSGDDNRFTAGCWENFEKATRIYLLFEMLTAVISYGTALGVDILAIILSYRWLKSNPDTPQAVRAAGYNKHEMRVMNKIKYPCILGTPPEFQPDYELQGGSCHTGVDDRLTQHHTPEKTRILSAYKRDERITTELLRKSYEKRMSTAV